MNVLLVRTSALGDVVQNLPALRALKRARPEGRISWLIDAVFAPLLEGHPDLHAVVPIASRGWRREGMGAVVAGHRALRRRLLELELDVAVDLMGNHKGGFLARLSGARRVVGAAREARREPSSALWIGEQIPISATHAVDRGLALAAALGAPPEPVDFGGDLILPEPPAETARALADGPARFVVVQAGAGWGNKAYPAERWGEVARRLREEAALPTLVPVAPGEEALAARVVAASAGAARAIDARAWAALVAVLRRAALVLGGDTGPVHLAQALGTPVLALHGPTDPVRHGPYLGPGRAAGRVLVHHLPCSFCHKRMDGPKACLEALAPAAVAAAALRLLDSGPAAIDGAL